jgi:hypothetical protein
MGKIKGMPRVIKAWLPDLLGWAAGLLYSVLLFSAAHTQFSVLDEGLYFKGFLFASGRYTPFQLRSFKPDAIHFPDSRMIQVAFGPGLCGIHVLRLYISAFWLVPAVNRWLASMAWYGAEPGYHPHVQLAIAEGWCLFADAHFGFMPGGKPRWRLVLAGFQG